MPRDRPGADVRPTRPPHGGGQIDENHYNLRGSSTSTPEPPMNRIRTSDNDPITVDFLPSEWVALPGKIGMTFAPGKQHRGMHFCWQRNLQKDLEQARIDSETSR